VIVGHRDPESGNAAQTGVLYLVVAFTPEDHRQIRQINVNQRKSTRFIWIQMNSSQARQSRYGMI
jgi:hypothetical protein